MTCPYALPVRAELIDGFWWLIEPNGDRFMTANLRLMTEAQAHWLRDAINAHGAMLDALNVIERKDRWRDKSCSLEAQGCDQLELAEASAYIDCADIARAGLLAAKGGESK